MRINLDDIARPKMAEIATAIAALLTTRKKAGPAEQALDDYIPQLKDVAGRLETHVEGRDVADATRATRLIALEIADDNVDRWYRHCQQYLLTESLRRTGDHGARAAALLDGAFPDGLGHVDDRIDDENTHLRKSLVVLRAPEHQQILAEMEMPPAFLQSLENALDASDAALAEVTGARKSKSGHVTAGQSAEEQWVDVMVRLRRYVGSRATRKMNPARYEEGRALIAPLLDELSQLRAEASTRETLAEKKAAAERAAAEKAAGDKGAKPAADTKAAAETSAEPVVDTKAKVPG